MREKSAFDMKEYENTKFPVEGNYRKEKGTTNGSRGRERIRTWTMKLDSYVPHLLSRILELDLGKVKGWVKSKVSHLGLWGKSASQDSVFVNWYSKIQVKLIFDMVEQMENIWLFPNFPLQSLHVHTLLSGMEMSKSPCISWRNSWQGWADEPPRRTEHLGWNDPVTVYKAVKQ